MSTKPNNENVEQAEFSPLDGLVTVVEYLAGDRKQRGAFRKSIERAAKSYRDQSGRLLKSGNVPEALTYLDHAEIVDAHLETVKAAAGSPAPVEFDYGQAIANRAATIRSAYAMIVAGMFDVPDEADVDMSALPTGQVDADLLARIMGMPMRRNSKQNDVKALITAAFVGKPVNTRLSVADVVRHARTLGSDVGNGAVTARATATVWTGHAGIVQVPSDKNGPIGFRNKVVIAESIEALADEADEDGDEG